MSSFSLYGINLYDEAVENLEIFKNISDNNVMYANYLLAVIYFERSMMKKKI